jgi:hypothetical protein
LQAGIASAEVAVENLRRLFLRGALEGEQAGTDAGELRRRVRTRRRRHLKNTNLKRTHAARELESSGE